MWRSAAHGCSTGDCTPDGQQHAVSRLHRHHSQRLPHRAWRRGGDGRKSKLDEGLRAFGLSSEQNFGLLLNLLGREAPRGALSGLDGVLDWASGPATFWRRIVQARSRQAPLILHVRGYSLARQRVRGAARQSYRNRRPSAPSHPAYEAACLCSAVGRECPGDPPRARSALGARNLPPRAGPPRRRPVARGARRAHRRQGGGQRAVCRRDRELPPRAWRRHAHRRGRHLQSLGRHCDLAAQHPVNPCLAHRSAAAGSARPPADCRGHWTAFRSRSRAGAHGRPQAARVVLRRHGGAGPHPARRADWRLCFQAWPRSRRYL